MRIIRNMLTSKIKVVIKIFVQSLYRMLLNQSKIETQLEFLLIKEKGYDIFFGYYDITPFNSFDDFLYLKRKKGYDDVEIYLSDSNHHEKKLLSRTKAWNWQQGCRLRWFPGSNNHIVFNTFENGDYAAKIIDKKGSVIRTLKQPLYDISTNGKKGLSLNFERLGLMRPGYGYTCKSYSLSNSLDESINIIDMDSDTIIDRITYRKITSTIPKNFIIDNCYVNHLAFSPDCESFLFFWIEIIEGYHHASLCVYDISRKNIIPLEVNEKVSHYVWIDNENILCTSYKSPSVCNYFLYNIIDRTRKDFCPISLSGDGHPSLDDECKILTDTYPDRNGFQHLYLVDSKNDTKETLLKVYMKPVENGEKRTDLHPRFNTDHSKICIDINKSGNRELVILKRIKNV